MNINDLTTLTANRLAYLASRKVDAERIGDVPTITALDAEIAETEQTADALRALAQEGV